MSAFGGSNTNLGLTNFRKSVATSSAGIGTISKKLAIVGGGNMASAIISSIYASKTMGEDGMKDITVVDIDAAKLKGFERQFGVSWSLSLKEGCAGADMLILCIKPQSLDKVSLELAELDFDSKNTLIVSILAGVNMKRLQESIPTCSNFVRVMPNTPIAVLEGVSVWYSNSRNKGGVAQEDLDRLKLLLSSSGEEIRVDNEELIEMATAISGSGPAYIFLLAETMIDTGVHLGFPRHIATALALQTIRGSISYAKQAPENLAELRYKVTSPGGTTASAVYELEKGRFRTVVADAIWSALRRARELGEKDPNVGPGRNQY